MNEYHIALAIGLVLTVAIVIAVEKYQRRRKVPRESRIVKWFRQGEEINRLKQEKETLKAILVMERDLRREIEQQYSEVINAAFPLGSKLSQIRQVVNNHDRDGFADVPVSELKAVLESE